VRTSWDSLEPHGLIAQRLRVRVPSPLLTQRGLRCRPVGLKAGATRWRGRLHPENRHPVAKDDKLAVEDCSSASTDLLAPH
jgi:hypothetical protein